MADMYVQAVVADRGLDMEFEVASGEVLAVLGPNGAGKSTTAAVIAGLLGADRAVVRVGSRTLTDTANGISVPTHDRRIGLLQQDPLLFPHFSVLANVEFAARRHAWHVGAGDGVRSEALGWLEAVGVAELARRRPHEISGGQAQRVALARALAAVPEVLLLDEPLAGLDVAGAATARAVLRRVLTDGSRPVLLITHDLLDVLALADRVLVIEGGRIAESGPTGRVLAAPRSDFAARIAGLNLVRGVLAGPGLLRTSAGQMWHGTNGGDAEELAAGQDAVAVFPPAAVAVYREQPQGSPRNSVLAAIAEVEVSGAAMRVRTAGQPDGTPGLAADVTAESVAALRLGVGERVWFTVKTQGVALHAAAPLSAHQR